MHRVPSTLAVFAACLLGLLPAGPGVLSAAPTTQNAVADAGRQAAEKAVRDGKHEEAIALLTKIIDEGNAKYQDYLMLGRSQEKLKHEREAAAAYRKVVELASDSSDKREERAAHREAKQKLATLDVIGAKIDALMKETEKKLLDLLREADKAGDWDSAGRLFKFYAALRNSRGDSVASAEVMANKSYQECNYKMMEGKTYRIRAVGRWKLSPKAECGPDGSTIVPANGYGPAGALLLVLWVETKPLIVVNVGSDRTLTCPMSASVRLVINEDKIWQPAGKEDNSGSVQVVIERLD